MLLHIGSSNRGGRNEGLPFLRVVMCLCCPAPDCSKSLHRAKKASYRLNISEFNVFTKLQEMFITQGKLRFKKSSLLWEEVIQVLIIFGIEWATYPSQQLRCISTFKLKSHYLCWMAEAAIEGLSLWTIDPVNHNFPSHNAPGTDAMPFMASSPDVFLEKSLSMSIVHLSKSHSFFFPLFSSSWQNICQKRKRFA